MFVCLVKFQFVSKVIAWKIWMWLSNAMVKASHLIKRLWVLLLSPHHLAV